MRLIPESAAEFGSNIRWSMEKLFRLIKELPPHPQVSGTGAPVVEEAMERIERAVERRDREAEDEAIEDCMRAQVSELLQGFPQRQRLSDLLERTARREEGRGSPDSRRRPSRSEILELARLMLADIGDTKRLDSEWEFGAMSIVLGDLRLPPIGAPSPETLQQYIELSGDSRVYFDALEHMYEVLDNRGQAMPRQLRKWRHGAGGGRGRPAKKRAPPPSAPSRWPLSCATSRSRSRLRSCAWSEYRRMVLTSRAVVSSRRCCVSLPTVASSQRLWVFPKIP